MGEDVHSAGRVYTFDRPMLHLSRQRPWARNCPKKLKDLPQGNLCTMGDRADQKTAEHASQGGLDTSQLGQNPPDNEGFQEVLPSKSSSRWVPKYKPKGQDADANIFNALQSLGEETKQEESSGESQVQEGSVNGDQAKQMSGMEVPKTNSEEDREVGATETTMTEKFADMLDRGIQEEVGVCDGHNDQGQGPVSSDPEYEWILNHGKRLGLDAMPTFKTVELGTEVKFEGNRTEVTSNGRAPKKKGKMSSGKKNSGDKAIDGSIKVCREGGLEEELFRRVG
ncbi:hypothetical protein R1sor_009759 [Riccia sorocarpa]|uniref:Breast cancer susceptibility 1 n=1 Tax=Riccia sorocarpa TaxID=122646 RepID=A0ABD3HW57_9MARC